MKTTILLINALFLTIILLGQGIEFNPTDYQNPSIFEKGQVPAHAVHIPFRNAEQALDNDIENCENYQLLNGNWQFKWVETIDEVPANFFDPKFKTKGWDEIKVPSNWQMEGYGHAKFRNIAMTFENDPPHIPEYYNPTGCYKHTFHVPESWSSKEVFLRFEGIKSASYVWVNGQRVGYNQGGFEPAEYNITKVISEGKNDISVQVMRYCDGSFLENQDMWRLSGIYRDVKLIAMPRVHIQDYFYYTDLDEDYRNADLNVEIQIANQSNESSADYSLHIDLFDEFQNSILEEKWQETFVIDGDPFTKIKTSKTILNPKKWSAEYPNLYTLLFELKDANGNTLEAFTKKVGFREVEMNGEVVTVNGVPVKLNGVNSHMHHPEHGQAVPLETLKEDLLIMKQFNINNVRTCHYPPTPEYLDLADELGMYIVDEVGDEAHDNIDLSYDESYTEMYKDRSRKLVHRDKNHASVLMWSAGNESGSGSNIDEVIKTGLAIDPTRPAWMYGGNTFYIPFEPVTGPRYWLPYQLRNLVERKVLGEDDLRPSYMDEYLAATGNGLGGLDEYWDVIWNYPRSMGGAIWDWISPGITTKLWTLTDGSPYENDGAIFGNPEFVKEKNRRALKFSGHDDWVEFYRDPSLDITGNQLTISFWVNPEEIAQPNTFITKGKHGYGIIMDSPETLEFYVNSNNVYDLSHSGYMYYNYKTERVSVVANVGNDWYGKWHHVVGIYDGEDMKLFIDDVLVAEKAHTGNIAHTPFPLCIGRDAETQDQGEHEGRMSKMSIDDVKIFNTALSLNAIGTEITRSYAVLCLDFEEDNLTNEEFYSVGLGGRTYGIVWPDREIQPEIYQIKKSGQPIAIEMVDEKLGKVKIINRHHFKNLNAFDLNWSVMIDGDEVEKDLLTINLSAQSETEKTIPFTKFHTDGEIILTLSFTLKDSTIWAKAGHEVAFEQFILQDKVTALEEADGVTNVEEVGDEFVVTGPNFEYRLNQRDGNFTKFNYNNLDYMKSGPFFNVWRIPTANDMDPWGAAAYSDKKKTPGFGRSIDNQLKTLGMRDFIQQVERVVANKKDGQVTLSVHKYYHSSNMRGSFNCFEKYTIDAKGKIDFEISITPEGEMPDMLPKLGYQLEMLKEFSNIEWYGRGEFETYPDRKTGAKIGVFESNVNDEYVPYIIPQEYGNHTDVRWVKVENKDGVGLMFKGDNPINFSYHKYSTKNLSRAYYAYQLEESESNFLNIDFEVSGVGGTAVRQLEKYRVKPGCKNYKVSIQPY